MTFTWNVTYYITNIYGIRLSRRPSHGYVHARTREQAEAKAREKFGEDIVNVE